MSPVQQERAKKEFVGILKNDDEIVWLGKHASDSFYVKLFFHIIFVIIYTIAFLLIGWVIILRYSLYPLFPLPFLLILQKFSSMLFRFINYQKTYYAISNHYFITKNNSEVKMVALKDIVNVELKTTLIDKIFNTGTIIFHNDNSQNYLFENTGLASNMCIGIKNPERVSALLKGYKFYKYPDPDSPKSTDTEQPSPAVKYGRNSRMVKSGS